MMSELTQIFIDLSGLKVGFETRLLLYCLISSFLGTWLKGGVERDLFLRGGD